MKDYGDRIWYEPREIESIAEDELARAGWPRLEGSVAIDIERFITRHLKVNFDFTELPEGVQGFTEFYANGKVEMAISAELADRAEEDWGALHRLRTTLAHEAAHVLLHRTLYLAENFKTLDQKRLCREVGFKKMKQYDWREWQANRGMGALLLPAGLVKRELVKVDPAGSRSKILQVISRRFAVSTDAVSFRLNEFRATKR
ncbi:MAG: ImmA/IrrE family metallo-endopeptidase [Thermodesulfobacteriota bacterium]